MNYLLVCATCLIIGWASGQSCCATTGSSSVAIGSSAGSTLLAKGELAWQSSSVFWGFQPLEQVIVVNSPIADVAQVGIWSNALAFGISDRLSLQFIQPYFWLNASFHGYDDNGQRQQSSGNIQGFSDGIMLGKTSVPLAEKLGLQANILMGIELPNGKTEFNSAGIANTLGSNSWDPLFGLNVYKRHNGWLFAFESQYKWTTTNRLGIDQGDLGSGFLYASSEVTNWKTKQIRATLGARGLWTDKLRADETVNVNSGGIRSFLSAGIALQKKKSYRWSLNANIPLFESINGQQNKTKIYATTALTFIIKSKNKTK